MLQELQPQAEERIRPVEQYRYGSEQGKVGVSLLYKWIDARGYRDAWDHTVRFKERLRQDALNKVELDVPEIDWDLWPQECTSDAHNTARAVKTD